MNNLNMDVKHRRRLIISTPFTSKRVISHGLIVYAMDSKRWVIIQQKHTIEFTLFIKGAYRPTFLPIYLSCITKTEAVTINKCLDCEEYFQEIYLKELNLAPDGLIYAKKRLHESCDIVRRLLSALADALADNKTDWGFPKGKASFSSERKSSLAVAQQRFVDEIGIQLPPALFISEDYVSETIKTLTNRILEYRYWIYIVPLEFSIATDNISNNIITKQWADTEVCKQIINNNALFEQVANVVGLIK